MRVIRGAIVSNAIALGVVDTARVFKFFFDRIRAR